MVGNGEDVELVIHDNAVCIFAEWEEKTFVESWLYFWVGISAVALVDVHSDGVELFETGHGPEEKDNKSSSLYSFDGPAE